MILFLRLSRIPGVGIPVMPSLYYSLWVYTISDPPAGSPRLHNNEFLPNSSQTTNTEHSITAPTWIFLFLTLVIIARQVFRMLVLSNGQTKVWSTLQCRPLRQGERIHQTCKMSHFYVLFSGWGTKLCSSHHDWLYKKKQ